MMNTPQLAALFLGVAILDTARLAARSFIIDWFRYLCFEKIIQLKEWG
jgi:hypothetical protein